MRDIERLHRAALRDHRDGWAYMILVACALGSAIGLAFEWLPRAVVVGLAVGLTIGVPVGRWLKR